MALGAEAQLVYVITGTSRGLGLEFAKQILDTQPEAVVVATARSPGQSEGLQQLHQQHSGRLHLFRLDLADHDSIKAAADGVRALFPETGVDVLINNAVVNELGLPRLIDVSAAEYTRVLVPNVVGTHLVTQSFYPLLKLGRRKLVVNITSTTASMSPEAAQARTPEPTSGPWARIDHVYLSYKVSKAAINRETVALAQSLKSEGFTFIALHPGWVATHSGVSAQGHMLEWWDGPPDALGSPMPAEESARKQLQVIGSVTAADNGRYLDFEGNDVPW